MSEWPQEPLADFSQRAQREAFVHALEQVQRQLGRDHPLLIDGRDVTTEVWRPSMNPAHPARAVGRVAQAGDVEVEQAIGSSVEIGRAHV